MISSLLWGECSTLAMSFFDDGGVVVSADDIDDGLKVDGF